MTVSKFKNPVKSMGWRITDRCIYSGSLTKSPAFCLPAKAGKSPGSGSGGGTGELEPLCAAETGGDLAVVFQGVIMGNNVSVYNFVTNE
jgi:hypothetical protein